MLLKGTGESYGIYQTTDTGRCIIGGGINPNTGARFYVCGNNRTTSDAGIFQMRTYNSSTLKSYNFVGKPDGTLTWANQAIPMPIGTIIWIAQSTAPTGYLICNGAEISQTTYNSLYLSIGDKYGAATTEGNFVLPNLIDKFPQGGTPSDTTEDNYKDAGLPNITGKFGADQRYAKASGAFYLDPYDNTTYAVSGSATYNDGVSFDASRSSSIYGNSTTVQPNSCILLPCIKY